MNLTLSNPCPVSATLTPCGDGTSACDHCPLRVHHLSALTKTAGERLVERGAQDRVCVQFFQNAQGEVLFAPTLRKMAAAGLLFVSMPAMADGHDDMTPEQAHILATEQNRARYALEQVGLTLGENGQVVHPDVGAVGPENGELPEPLYLVDGGI